MRRQPTTTPKMELNSYLGRAGVLNYLNQRLRDRNDGRTLFTAGASRKCLRPIRADVILGDYRLLFGRRPISRHSDIVFLLFFFFGLRGFVADVLAEIPSIGFDARLKAKICYGFFAPTNDTHAT